MSHSPAPLRLAVLAALALSASATQAAVFITVTTDTPTMLAGSFDAHGSGFNSKSTDFFTALPGGDNGLLLSRFGVVEEFGADVTGTPDDSYYSRNSTGAFSGGLWTGEYTNGGSGNNQTVDFAFTNLRDTGGANGDFRGDFVFTLAAVPEPGEYATVAGLALAGFALWRRRQTK